MTTKKRRDASATAAAARDMTGQYYVVEGNVEAWVVADRNSIIRTKLVTSFHLSYVTKARASWPSLSS